MQKVKQLNNFSERNLSKLNNLKIELEISENSLENFKKQDNLVLSKIEEKTDFLKKEEKEDPEPEVVFFDNEFKRETENLHKLIEELQILNVFVLYDRKNYALQEKLKSFIKSMESSFFHIYMIDYCYFRKLRYLWTSSFNLDFGFRQINPTKLSKDRNHFLIIIDVEKFSFLLMMFRL